MKNFNQYLKIVKEEKINEYKGIAIGSTVRFDDTNDNGFFVKKTGIVINVNNQHEYYEIELHTGKKVKVTFNDVTLVNELRNVTVKFSDGSEINTDMAANLTDPEIRDYYKIGKQFNLGNSKVAGDGNIGDNIQTVVDVIINESAYNMMTLVIPPVVKWVKDQVANGIEYMGKTWYMRPKDIDMFKSNIGKLIKFRYDKEAKPMYMEFATIRESVVNERIYIETWYNDGKTQLLGSDGTTVLKDNVGSKELSNAVESQIANLKSLAVNVKPFLKDGFVVVRVVRDGNVTMHKKFTIE